MKLHRPHWWRRAAVLNVETRVRKAVVLGSNPTQKAWYYIGRNCLEIEVDLGPGNHVSVQIPLRGLRKALAIQEAWLATRRKP